MRGTRYIPRGQLPPSAFDVPGVRVTQKTGTVMVPWHAYHLIPPEYKSGFRMVPGRRVESTLSFYEDPISVHPYVSDETRAKATPAQREDLRRVLSTSGGILDWPTGSGKTLIGLAFSTAFGLPSSGPEAGGVRSLVVVPSTTTEQWRRQAGRWLTPQVRVGIILQGRPQVRKRKECSWIVTDEAQRKLFERGHLTLALRERWGEEALLEGERDVLRKAKARFEAAENWFLLDDLDNPLAGPFLTAAEAAGAREDWSPGDYDVLVVGWGVLPQVEVRDALVKWDPKILVIDEAHRLGKQGSMWRARKTADPTVDAPIERKAGAASNVHAISSECAAACMLMTATPQGDLPKNWHALLDVYDPYSFGSFYNFGVRYCNGHHGEYGMVFDGLSNAEELRSRLQKFWYYRSKAETHKGLPPVRREFVQLTLRQAARVDMAALGTELREADAGGSPTAMQIAVATEQKIDWAIDRIQEYVRSGLRVFVWVALRANARRLQAELVGKVDCPVYRADGTLTSAERAAMVDEFVGPNGVGPGAGVMIGTINAFGEAIDGLQHVDVALVLTVPWTPQLLIQGPEGRHNRLGGTRSVLLVYVCLTGTIDDRIWSRMGEKLAMSAEVRNDQDARTLGQEIRGDSPEQQEAALAAMADLLAEWQGQEGAWRDSARIAGGVSGSDDLEDLNLGDE